jgi:hypothetical protein
MDISARHDLIALEPYLLGRSPLDFNELCRVLGAVSSTVGVFNVFFDGTFAAHAPTGPGELSRLISRGIASPRVSESNWSVEDNMASLLVYDPTIRDYLNRSDVSLQELMELRQKARAFLREHGNVANALLDLDEEIERRTGTAKSAPSN